MRQLKLNYSPISFHDRLDTVPIFFTDLCVGDTGFAVCNWQGVFTL